MTNNTIAILISDIHFNINTLRIASLALNIAINEANLLGVPVVICGDLHDTKAIIRAEIANALIQLLSKCKHKPYILVGNHDLVNEKGKEHGLNYLAPYAHIIDTPKYAPKLNVWFFPYMSDPSKLKNQLPTVPGILIMHQGFKGAFMGDYIQDKTSIDTDVVTGHTVYSGHYHRHQMVDNVVYVGNPYTLSFGEANDGPKGYLYLFDTGGFKRKPLNLPKHVIYELELNDVTDIDVSKAESLQDNTGDKIWLKLKGPKSELTKINKKELGIQLFGHSNYKLDLIPNDNKKELIQKDTKPKTDKEVLDKVIEAIDDTEGHKSFLKELAYEIINGRD